MGKNTSALKRGFTWDEANSRLSVYVNGQEAMRYDAGTTYPDMTLSGDTTGCSLVWDASEDKLTLTQTNASTSGTETSFLSAMTCTGAGSTPEGAVCSLTVNAACGAWANALVARQTYGTSGSTTGLGAALCTELNLSAGTSSGTYCCIDNEMIMATGASTGTLTSFIRFTLSGAAASTFDTSGVLFDIAGCTSGSGKFWYDNTANAADEFIKVHTPSGTRYLVLTDDTSFA